MNTNLLDTKTLSFREIIGNGKNFEVPIYQRDYSWKEENWEELWFDIENLLENKSEIHYMGSIVIQYSRDKTYIIIDGQQRLTTLSILILSCINILKEFRTDEDKEREELIRNTFIGNKDGISLNYSSKLKLNNNNNEFYCQFLNQLRTPLNPKIINDSNKLMLNAYNYFIGKISQKDFSKSGIEIYKFIDNVIGDKLLFIQIIVNDEMAAYTVFETLNARGLELTTTDLLKNYLFSLVKSQIDINLLQIEWKEISNKVGIKKLPQFIRYYYNSKYMIIRTERLFKEIRNLIHNQDEVFKFIHDLSQYADLYIALDDDENELWKEMKDTANTIKEICLYQSEQQKILLMSAYFNFNPSDFLKILRIVKAIIFRYTVISVLNPNELERCYSKVAIDIFNKNITRVEQVFDKLQPIYPSDENFMHDFSTKIINTANTKNKKIVRHILISIENQKSNKNYSVYDIDATIEHILPENPNEKWLSEYNYTDEDIEMGVYRLGNLTLLEEKMNKNAANSFFTEKKAFYEKSQYGITQNISQKDTWTLEDIKERQNQLAKIALTVWKANY